MAAVEPYLKILAPAPDQGWLHCGPAGSGHFVKMIHNGIEYGMMQAFAEGFALMQGKTEFNLDLAAIAEMWRHGSVVRSWLLDLTAEFLAEGADLGAIQPVVADSGEGRWTVLEAVNQGVPAPVMSLALMSPLRQPGQGGLRQQDAGQDAPRVWRTCGEENVMTKFVPDASLPVSSFSAPPATWRRRSCCPRCTTWSARRACRSIWALSPIRARPWNDEEWRSHLRTLLQQGMGDHYDEAMCARFVARFNYLRR